MLLVILCPKCKNHVKTITEKDEKDRTIEIYQCEKCEYELFRKLLRKKK
jgi:DNA-directed RNA polymerase subunit M/transcription elongation factor TFIIS